MEIETALRRHLLADETVNGLVSGKVFKRSLKEPISGTSSHAIVVKQNGGWRQGDVVQSIKYPLVEVVCFADPDRDDDGLVTTANAGDKALALLAVVDRLLHRQYGQWWGAGGSSDGRFVVECVRWSEPSDARPENYADGDSALMDVEAVFSRYAITSYEGQRG